MLRGISMAKKSNGQGWDSMSQDLNRPSTERFLEHSHGISLRPRVSKTSWPWNSFLWDFWVVMELCTIWSSEHLRPFYHLRLPWSIFSSRKFSPCKAHSRNLARSWGYSSIYRDCCTRTLKLECLLESFKCADIRNMTRGDDFSSHTGATI